MTSRSSAENIFGMYSALSAPIAVFAGERSAGIDAVLQNLGADFRGEIGLPGNLLVVADQRMQVAVAGVEHVADAKAAARLELTDAIEHLGQLRPRHDAVLDVVVRRHAPHRRERALPPLPDPRAMCLVLRDLHRRRARAMADRLDLRELLAHFRDGPSSSTIRIASAGGKFGWTAASTAMSDTPSMISTAAGMMPAAMISETAVPAALIES